MVVTSCCSGLVAQEVGESFLDGYRHGVLALDLSYDVGPVVAPVVDRLLKGI
jgi:hypothetical protein